MPEFVISDQYRTELGQKKDWELNSLEYTLGQEADAAVNKAEELAPNARNRPDLDAQLTVELAKSDELIARLAAIASEKKRRERISMRGG